MYDIMDNNMNYTIKGLPKYELWFDKQPKLIKAQIEKRLTLIRLHGHLGRIKHIDSKLWEIKFNNGLRIYFYKSGYREITLVLGGTKHGQQKDIEKAKRIYD